MKKIIGLFLILVLAVGLLASCFPTKFKYYDGRTSTTSDKTLNIVSPDGKLVEIKPVDININSTQHIESAGIKVDPVTVKQIELKPLEIQSTNPISLQLVSTGAFQARVMVDPIRIDLSNSVQIVSCCCHTNDSNGTNKWREREPSPPQFSDQGPHGWLWGLPALCIIIAGLAGRPLGRYLGIIRSPKTDDQEQPILDVYDKQRQEFQDWLKGKLQELQPKPSGWFKAWLESKPRQDRKWDFRIVRNNLYSYYHENFKNPPPKDVLDQLEELEKIVRLLPDDLWVLPTNPWKDSVTGLVAAALSPVFLSFFSNNLFVAAADNPFSLVTFFGFCLLAAMLGADFIHAIFELFRMLVEGAKRRMTDGK